MLKSGPDPADDFPPDRIHPSIDVMRLCGPPEAVGSSIVNLQETEPGPRKLRVLMLCAHEPAADPRISWAARSAAAAFDVTVLGFASDAAAASDTAQGYR